MTVTISISELKQRQQTTKAVPYGAALIGACAKKKFGDEIELSLFKEADEYLEFLEVGVPKISCFSTYVWNTEISFEMARQVKRADAGNIVIFGGPHYPLEEFQQKEYLIEHPYIDFFVYREGEETFVELLETLKTYDFNADALKADRAAIPGCHYVWEGEAMIAAERPRLVDLNDVPSPYLTGLCDKFLEQGMIPLVQTTRGCPFACTFCQEGESYYSKVRRFDLDRLAEELAYIAQRTPTPSLFFADSNFGMYSQDLELSKKIVEVQKTYGWPKYVMTVQGKNNKESVLEIAQMINGHLSAAVQSTDDTVLASVKRKGSISNDDLITVAKGGEKRDLDSFSELILCLPGDSKRAHLNSFADLIDTGIKTVRSHQFAMLIGSEAARPSVREEFEMVTRYRPVPNTFSDYRLGDHAFTCPEIDEICVANKTMSYEDYLDCRLFTLTVEIFYNDSFFSELIRFLGANDVKISEFVSRVHHAAITTSKPLGRVYAGFRKESDTLWEERETLDEFLRQPESIARILAGEICFNEQLVFRAIAVVKHMDEIQAIAFDVAREMLAEKIEIDDIRGQYLEQLATYTLCRRNNVFDTNREPKERFDFDFLELERQKFSADPSEFYVPGGMEIRFAHSDEQKKLISQYVDLYGLSDIGIGTLFGNGTQLNRLYRMAV